MIKVDKATCELIGVFDVVLAELMSGITTLGRICKEQGTLSVDEYIELIESNIPLLRELLEKEETDDECSSICS